jgi:RNA polymerase sigma factor (TIGR02999 family)
MDDESHPPLEKGPDPGDDDSLEESWTSGSAPDAGEFTRRLRRDGRAPDDVNGLLAMVYRELHDRAVREKARFPENSLQATEVLNAAYLRLTEKGKTTWKNRRYFFFLAGRAMREVLWDHMRRKERQKRGGGLKAVSLDSMCGRIGVDPPLLSPLVTALRTLAREDPWGTAVVELRFFYGLTREEIAAHLRVSSSTVDRRWTAAKCRLYRLMHRVN